MRRGEVWWADLGEPAGSEPGWLRPFVIVQSDALNRSGLQSIIGVTFTTNQRWRNAPGNVFLPAGEAGLQHDSVANVTQIAAIDRDFLIEFIGVLPRRRMRDLDRGLRLVLGL